MAAVSARSNARWIGAIEVFRVAVQLVGLLLLSRLLSREDFGLGAMASIVTNLANLLRDMGTAAVVVRIGLETAICQRMGNVC